MNILGKFFPANKQQGNKAVFFFSLTIFFFAVANGITSYYFPILALETGLSYTAMGILYSSSSVFGIIFDVLLSKYLKNTDYKMMYLYATILLIAFPIMIVYSSMLSVYVVGVAIWALYSNLSGFGYYDFTATEEKKENHAKSFASLSVLNALGYVVAPLIAVYSVIKLGDFRSILLPVFAGIVTLMFVLFTISASKRNNKPTPENTHPNRTFKNEIAVLLKVGIRLWPLLLLHLNLCIMEATFWTVSPIIENLSAGLKGMGGLMLALSMLPSLIICWSVDPLTKSFGKKNTAFYTFLFSNLLLLVMGYVSNAYVILLLVFLVNLLQSITYPAVAAAIADYLKESTSYDNEIVATNDISANAGYVIGPAIAGIALDVIGDLRIFSIIALFGILSSVVLIAFSPKKIPFYDKNITE